MISCPGNGGASGHFDDGSGETYTGSSSNSSGSSGADGTYTANFSFDEFLRLTDSGDTDALTAMFRDDSASSGSSTGGGEYGVDTLVMSASDLGVPAGGSVTLSITGGDEDYEETVEVDDDGNVCFNVPRQRVGSTITVSMEVMKEDGTVVLSGKKTQEVKAGIQFGIALSSGAPEDFVFVAGGTFTSANSTLSAAGSQTIADFYICIHEVTQGEYEKYCGYGVDSPSSSYGVGTDFPAYYVSWYDALVYCNRRSLSEGLTPCYTISGSTNPDDWGTIPTSSNATWNAASYSTSADGYRLPTEAEWEYAASDGHECSGADMANVGTVAWYDGNSDGKTHPVKKKTANAKGIYDMSGNVWEWCWDKYSSSSSDRVSRGGSWSSGASYCEVSIRGTKYPYYRGDYFGFRVVRKAE